MLPLRMFLVLLALLVPTLTVGAADTDKYLPDRTEVVVTVRVKALLAAPLVKDHLEAVKERFKKDQEAQKVLALVGLDPFADLDSIVLTASGNPDNDQPVALLQGSFDNARVEAALEKASKEAKPRVKVLNVAGHKVYEVRCCEAAVYFLGLLDQGLLVGSADRNSVQEALDKKAGKRKAQVRRDLELLLAKADTRHVLSVASLARPLQFAGLLNDVGNNVLNVTGGVTLEEDLKLELDLQARDVQTARVAVSLLEDRLNQVKGLVAVAVLQNQGLKPLADLVAGIKLNVNGTTGTLRLTLTKEFLDTALKQAP